MSFTSFILTSSTQVRSHYSTFSRSGCRKCGLACGKIHSNSKRSDVQTGDDRRLEGNDKSVLSSFVANFILLGLPGSSRRVHGLQKRSRKGRRPCTKTFAVLSRLLSSDLIYAVLTNGADGVSEGQFQQVLDDGTLCSTLHSERLMATSRIAFDQRFSSSFVPTVF